MSIAENGVKFKDLEKRIYKKVCEYGCEHVKEMLEELDGELGAKRDKKKYRSKGKRKKVIKTIMGEVEFSRTVYEVVKSEIKSYVYLLDEEIELTESGLAIAEKMYERHLFISRWLEHIGVDAETAARDACRIEHVISDVTFEAIKKHAGQKGL